MEQIRTAQFVDHGMVNCIGSDRKTLRPRMAVNVKDFIETQTRKKTITDTTIIFANGKMQNVAQFKKELGMDTLWYRIKKKFFS